MPEDIFTSALADAEQMSDSDLREALEKYRQNEEERRERQKKYNTSPEAIERRKQYNDERKRKMDPTSPEYDEEFTLKIKAARKEYMDKNKEARKQYNQKRNAKMKALLEVAKKRGFVDADGNVAA